MNDKTIRVLDMTPVGQYREGPRYSFCVGGFPSRGVRVVREDFDTPEAAYRRAVEAVREYERKDPYGNMGAALGVTLVNGKYRPVINTFHSNT